MATQKAPDVGRLKRRWNHQQRKDVRVQQKPDNEDGDGGNPRPKQLSILNGQRSQHENIEKIGKEQVPLKHRDDAHGHE
jgi:hypothetical protein